MDDGAALLEREPTKEELELAELEYEMIQFLGEIPETEPTIVLDLSAEEVKQPYDQLFFSPIERPVVQKLAANIGSILTRQELYAPIAELVSRPGEVVGRVARKIIGSTLEAMFVQKGEAQRRARIG